MAQSRHTNYNPFNDNQQRSSDMGAYRDDDDARMTRPRQGDGRGPSMDDPDGGYAADRARARADRFYDERGGYGQSRGYDQGVRGFDEDGPRGAGYGMGRHASVGGADFGADRYRDRQLQEPRGYFGGDSWGGRDGRREERGMMERAGDEIASWFGDDAAARRREDDHRGKGPRGYRRSDSRILEDVNDRLSDDAQVDASSIDVSVKDGEVTLSGEVGSKFAKRRAEDCADGASGVTHVQNNLRVKTTAQGTDLGATIP